MAPKAIFASLPAEQPLPWKRTPRWLTREQELWSKEWAYHWHDRSDRPTDSERKEYRAAFINAHTAGNAQFGCRDYPEVHFPKLYKPVEDSSRPEGYNKDHLPQAPSQEALRRHQAKWDALKDRAKKARAPCLRPDLYQVLRAGERVDFSRRPTQPLSNPPSAALARSLTRQMAEEHSSPPNTPRAAEPSHAAHNALPPMQHNDLPPMQHNLLPPIQHNPLPPIQHNPLPPIQQNPQSYFSPRMLRPLPLEVPFSPPAPPILEPSTQMNFGSLALQGGGHSRPQQHRTATITHTAPQSHALDTTLAPMRSDWQGAASPHVGRPLPLHPPIHPEPGDAPPPSFNRK